MPKLSSIWSWSILTLSQLERCFNHEAVQDSKPGVKNEVTKECLRNLKPLRAYSLFEKDAQVIFFSLKYSTVFFNPWFNSTSGFQPRIRSAFAKDRQLRICSPALAGP